MTSDQGSGAGKGGIPLGVGGGLGAVFYRGSGTEVRGIQMGLGGGWAC